MLDIAENVSDRLINEKIVANRFVDLSNTFDTVDQRTIFKNRYVNCFR